MHRLRRNTSIAAGRLRGAPDGRLATDISAICGDDHAGDQRSRQDATGCIEAGGEKAAVFRMGVMDSENCLPTFGEAGMHLGRKRAMKQSLTLSIFVAVLAGTAAGVEAIPAVQSPDDSGIQL